MQVMGARALAVARVESRGSFLACRAGWHAEICGLNINHLTPSSTNAMIEGAWTPHTH